MSEFVLTPLKYIVVDRISNGVGLPAEHENPEWPRYIRTTDIAGPRALRDDVWYSQPPALLRQAGVEPGDLLLTNAGTVGKAYLHTSDESAVFAGYLTRVRPNPLKADSRYVAYCCESQPYWDQINTGATRSTIDNFSSGKYQDLRIPIPPLGTQRRIAEMLDTETARIDTLIEKNERVLTLLQRRWQSLLEQVIFGYASARRVPLWLVCEITPGYAFHSNEFRLEGSVRLLRGINVGVGGIDWRETVYADVSTVESAKEYQLVEGDLVVGMDRPWISAGLRVAQVRAVDEPAYLVQRVARLRPRTGLDRD